MTERERLIELLDSADTCYMQKSNPEPRYFSAFVADYLIESGVRLPVTCGECKYCFPYHRDYVRADEIYCSHYPYKNCYVLVEKDDFCNYGERRADKC